MRSGVPKYLPVDTSYLTLPVLGYIPVPTELEGCLLHTEMSQPPKREHSHTSSYGTGSQSQSQSKDYNQNLLVRYIIHVAYNVPVLFLSKKGQPNPAARTLRIKVGLYRHPSQNFKINTYRTPRHDKCLRSGSLLGIFCKVTRYMMCFFIVVLTPLSVSLVNASTSPTYCYM